MKDLMTPRYEVIADYPESKFKIGQTVTLKEIHPYSGYSFISGDFILSPEWFDKYPHLFRKLQWYEKRDIKDMPEYVKKSDGIVYPVDYSEMGKTGGVIVDSHATGKLNRLLVNYENMMQSSTPATQSEYEAYINSKQLTNPQGGGGE